jgi:hypothetical protein
MVPILSILYTEPKPETYAGVRLRMYEDKPEELFNSGNPAVDFFTAGFVAHYRLGPDAHIMGSSSIDHFVMDGGVLEDEEPSDDAVKQAIAAGKAYLESRGEAPPKKG